MAKNSFSDSFARTSRRCSTLSSFRGNGERGGQTKAACGLRLTTGGARSRAACTRRTFVDPLLYAGRTTDRDLSCNGWFRSYDFSSLERVRVRRRTAYTAGVDYIAIDQYEHLAAYLNEPRSTIQRSQGPNTGERFRQGNLSPSIHDCGTRRTR